MEANFQKGLHREDPPKGLISLIKTTGLLECGHEGFQLARIAPCFGCSHPQVFTGCGLFPVARQDFQLPSGLRPRKFSEFQPKLKGDSTFSHERTGTRSRTWIVDLDLRSILREP